MHPKTLIYLLKILGEDAPGMSKKKKNDLGKSIDEDTNSCRPSTVGPYD